jgi:N-acetylglucosamine-6-phosphate deacetylase
LNSSSGALNTSTSFSGIAAVAGGSGADNFTLTTFAFFGSIAGGGGTDTLAGSTLTQDAALANAIELAQVDPVLAVRAVTASPARALGLDERLGYLRPGFAADAVLLDDRWRATTVFANGRRLV